MISLIVIVPNGGRTAQKTSQDPRAPSATRGHLYQGFSTRLMPREATPSHRFRGFLID